jgi:Zn-dependent protease with chaperone function
LRHYNTSNASCETVVTQSILQLGRYAVLPVAALAVAVFMCWLAAFDAYPRMAARSLPLVLPVTTIALALAIGLLLPIRRRKERDAADETAAPGLWAMWNELDAETPRARRTLVIDPELNASIGERRRYLALAHRDLTMTVGLSLLLVLDDRAVRAVVAHEVAHARLQHTTGGANLYEFIVAAANLFDHLDPERTITGRIAHILLKSLLGWVWAEFHAIGYRNELAADGEAGERTGAHEMARALVLSHHAAWGLKELIDDPLDKELLGAIRAPTPPLQRVVDQLDAIWAYRTTDVGEPRASEEPDAEKDCHPPLRERLANLGFAAIPDVVPPGASAAESLLSAQALKQRLTEFNDRWRRNADARIGLH